MTCQYETSGVCSRKISFDLEDDKIYNIHFEGGCPGNLKMLSKILDGWDANKIVDMCKGNLCGNRNTSCADQLSKAIEKALEDKKIGC